MRSIAAEETYKGKLYFHLNIEKRRIFFSFCYLSESLLATEDTDVPTESMRSESPYLFSFLFFFATTDWKMVLTHF